MPVTHAVSQSTPEYVGSCLELEAITATSHHNTPFLTGEQVLRLCSCNTLVCTVQLMYRCCTSVQVPYGCENNVLVYKLDRVCHVNNRPSNKNLNIYIYIYVTRDKHAKISKTNHIVCVKNEEKQ